MNATKIRPERLNHTHGSRVLLRKTTPDAPPGRAQQPYSRTIEQFLGKARHPLSISLLSLVTFAASYEGAALQLGRQNDRSRTFLGTRTPGSVAFHWNPDDVAQRLLQTSPQKRKNNVCTSYLSVSQRDNVTYGAKCFSAIPLDPVRRTARTNKRTFRRIRAG